MNRLTADAGNVSANVRKAINAEMDDLERRLALLSGMVADALGVQEDSLWSEDGKACKVVDAIRAFRSKAEATGRRSPDDENMWRTRFDLLLDQLARSVGVDRLALYDFEEDTPTAQNILERKTTKAAVAREANFDKLRGELAEAKALLDHVDEDRDRVAAAESVVAKMAADHEAHVVEMGVREESLDAEIGRLNGLVMERTEGKNVATVNWREYAERNAALERENERLRRRSGVQVFAAVGAGWRAFRETMKETT